MLYYLIPSLVDLRVPDFVHGVCHRSQQWMDCVLLRRQPLAQETAQQSKSRRQSQVGRLQVLLRGSSFKFQARLNPSRRAKAVLSPGLPVPYRRSILRMESSGGETGGCSKNVGNVFPISFVDSVAHPLSLFLGGGFDETRCHVGSDLVLIPPRKGTGQTRSSGFRNATTRMPRLTISTLNGLARSGTSSRTSPAKYPSHSWRGMSSRGGVASISTQTSSLHSILVLHTFSLRFGAWSRDSTH